MKSSMLNKNQFIFFFSIILALLIILQSLPLTVPHDLSSYLAPAIAILEGYGQPYQNYFDIKPPISVYFFYPWIYFFGYSLYSIIILYFIVLIISFYCLYKILLQIHNKNITKFVFLFIILVSILNENFENFFSSEVIGNFFIFLSLYIYFFNKDFFFKWIVIGLLTFLAGQTKEVYFFSIFAFIFIIFSEKKMYKKNLLTLLSGWFLGLVLMLIILFYNNILNDYYNIILFKKEIFSVKWISYGYQIIKIFLSLVLHLNIIFLFFIYYLFKIYVYKKKNFLIIIKKNLFSNLKLNCLIALCFSIMVGFIWQFKPPYGHYFLSIWPLFITMFYSIIVQLFKFTNYNSRIFNEFYLIPFLIISLFFNLLIFDKFDGNKIIKNTYSFFNLKIEDYNNLKLYKKMNIILGENNCFQTVYGWNTGSTHIYLNKPPCSKFFLSNLIINDKIIDTYRKELLFEPPYLVVYNYLAGLDALNAYEFEENVFPWGNIMLKCYDNTQIKDVFIAKYQKKEMQNCFSNEMKKAGIKN